MTGERHWIGQLQHSLPIFRWFQYANVLACLSPSQPRTYFTFQLLHNTVLLPWDGLGILLEPGRSCPKRNILLPTEELFLDKGQAPVVSSDPFPPRLQSCNTDTLMGWACYTFQQVLFGVLKKIFCSRSKLWCALPLISLALCRRS